MPVVNLGLQLRHLNITADFTAETHLRLLFSAALSLLGLLLLIALRLVSGGRYKAQPKPLPWKVVATATSQRKAWLSEQSRGVTSRFDTMSNQQTSRTPSLDTARQSPARLVDSSSRDNSPKGQRRKGSRENMATLLNVDAKIQRDVQSRAKPPLPPPSAPPVLSTGKFHLKDRRPSITASVAGDFQTSVIHEPNTGYTTASSSDSPSTDISHSTSSPAIPRRRSYSKMLPLGALHPISVPEKESGTSSPAFSPSSFPSSSPILPLAPHESLDQFEADAQEDTTSITDDSGAAWKRHTRVYGGGVCLACLASGGHHGEEGGFYGDSVPMDQRR